MTVAHLETSARVENMTFRNISGQSSVYSSGPFINISGQSPEYDRGLFRNTFCRSPKPGTDQLEIQALTKVQY
jgi:hypothetical protein